MKNLLFSLLLLMTSLVHSQDKTFSRAELDSKSKAIDSSAFENVPIYNGCETKIGNANKKQCMSDKVSQHFQKNFNTTLHKDSKIEPGFKRILVIFKIGKDGQVIAIDTRAEDEFLEAEAKRVTQLIPQMIPGRIDGKAVIVPYSVPLKIEVVAPTDGMTSTYPIYRGCQRQSTNEELKACSKRKIMNFIKLSYDTEMANRVFPLEQSTQFLLEFIINKKGQIEQVNAKANHRAIAIEAIKVAKRLPKFKAPGTLNGEPVDTPFGLLMTIYFE